MTGETVAVITGDIIDSRRYTSEERLELDYLLKKSFESAAANFPDTVHGDISFSTVQGDEFQFVLQKPERAYSFLVFMRSVFADSPLEPKPRYRAAIGIGEIAVPEGNVSYAMDGAAFHFSRDGINKMAQSRNCRDRLTILTTAHAALDESVNIVLMYQDMLERRWTREQHIAVRLRFENGTYEKIGEKIKIAPQNVQKRLKAAHWEEFSLGMHYIERTLISPLKG